MRNHLGYQASDMNVPVGDEPREQGRFVDVRGERYGVAWHRLRTVAFLTFVAAVVLRTTVPVPRGATPIAPNVLLFVAIVAFLAAYLGRVRTRQYTWVQCTEKKAPVSRADILALDDSVKKVRASPAAKWKPAQVFLVAGANGFERDAAAFARSLGIECYLRTEVGFVRAT